MSRRDYQKDADLFRKGMQTKTLMFYQQSGTRLVHKYADEILVIKFITKNSYLYFSVDKVEKTQISSRVETKEELTSVHRFWG